MLRAPYGFWDHNALILTSYRGNPCLFQPDNVELRSSIYDVVTSGCRYSTDRPACKEGRLEFCYFTIFTFVGMPHSTSRVHSIYFEVAVVWPTFTFTSLISQDIGLTFTQVWVLATFVLKCVAGSGETAAAAALTPPPPVGYGPHF